MKKPTVVQFSEQNRVSFLTMKELPGQELMQIIQDDYQGKKVLSVQQRLDLTKSLLKQLKKQVFNHSLVHRDVKPETL